MSSPPTPRRVALLESSVAERIAAGEVIERPSSIVKELVENAIDAGSTRIWVDMVEGGQASLQISDNGCGMSREDAVLALSRFATSKIRTWDDMEALQTLGFRGEALPSVVAVSRLELLTREADAAVGTRIIARGADAVQVTEAGCPAGTTATVSELFFNTPARRKFLKSSVAEAARIVDLLGRFSLLHTNIHFRLTGGNREFFNFPLQYGLGERLRRLWHVDARGGLVDIARVDGEARISGVVVGPPAFANTRTRQVIYVNGRLVVNAALSQALSQGFEPLIPDRRFPMAVLFIEIPSGHVDVNVHPTKSEVRFLYPRQLFKLVKEAVAEALVAKGAQPHDPVDIITRLKRGEADELAGDTDAAGLPDPPRSHTSEENDARRGRDLDPPRAPATFGPPPTGRATPAWQGRRERPLLEQVQAAIDATAPLTERRSLRGEETLFPPRDETVQPPSADAAWDTPDGDRTHDAVPSPPLDPEAWDATTRFSSVTDHGEADPATRARVDASELAENEEASAGPAAPVRPPSATTEELPGMPVPRPLARVTAPAGSRWQVLAQLHRTYIVCLRGDELWLVDQHTAHERVHYELLAHITDGSRPVASQPLLFPLMLELPPAEAAALASSLDIFEQLGYQIEPFGGETVVVRALPAGFKALSKPEVLRQVIADVTNDDRAKEPHRLRELLRATTACRASVMAGDTLTREEMEMLLVRLEAVPRGGYCPHGRPVSIRLAEDDLARLFGRR